MSGADVAVLRAVSDALFSNSVADNYMRWGAGRAALIGRQRIYVLK